ncbi:MAG: methyltransferase [Pseudomonadota bacterium]
MTPAAAVGSGPVSGLLERWRRSRDRLLASDRFRRWAATFPLTRPVARRRVRALFDLAAGFVYTQVLTVCVELGLFERLAKAPETAESLAAHYHMPPESMARLLDAATSLKLLEDRGGTVYGLGKLGAAMVDNPGVVEMVRHHRLLYADLADPLALLNGTQTSSELAAYWAYAKTGSPTGLKAEQVAQYSLLMAASQPMIAEEILNAFSFAKVQHVMDVGGGEGAFLTALASRGGPPQLSLFDLPSVVKRAEQRLHAANLGQRITLHGGDFFRDSLPQGADLITLIRIVHDHSDEQALVLIKAIHAALPPGGRLLLAEPMADTPGAEPIGAAYFGFYLLAMGSGRARSRAEIRDLLTQGGFSKVRSLRTNTPLLACLLLAER